MSTDEVITVIICLSLGYWIVSKVIGNRPTDQQKEQQNQHSESSQDEPNASNSTSGSSDWYEVLNVAPTASSDEIRNAYKTLIKQYHPDKVSHLGTEFHSIAEQKSKELTNAYQTGMRIRGK